MTKTITLSGAEVSVALDGAHAHIRNDSADVIYAAKTASITAGADGVTSIPAGQAATVRSISGKVYLLGTGSVHIQSDDYAASPFKTSAQAGGSGADDVARAAINTHSGNAEIHVTATEKAAWNGKAELSDIPTNYMPKTGGDILGPLGMGNNQLWFANCAYIQGAGDTLYICDSSGKVLGYANSADGFFAKRAEMVGDYTAEKIAELEARIAALGG